MKTIVVTGASGDIGFSIVQRLLKENYRVIAVCRDTKRFSEIESLTTQKDAIDMYTVDLRYPEEIALLCEKIKDKYQDIFGLVNNAGVYPMQRVGTYTLDVWNDVMMINLTSAFLMIQYLLPNLENKGKIINIASTAAHLGSRDPGYSASKSGLIGLTKSLARTLDHKNISVNAVAPGIIDTKMSRQTNLEDRDRKVKSTIANRLGVPEDVSGVVAFLLSPDASYITGSTIDVNGGLYIR